VHGNRVGVYVRTESELAADVTYTAFSLGVAYRR